MTLPQTYETFIKRLPKSELHCHLEGAIRPETVIDLAEKNGIELPFATVEGAEEYYDFEDLDGFLEVFSLACRTLRTADDFERVTVDLAADSARQNIPYREVFFTYAYHARRDVPWKEVIDGIASGRKKAKEEYDVELRFIADIDRTVDSEEGVELVERAHEDRDEAAIVGIGLDSQEQGYPAHRHEAAFQRATELGFKRVAHAGEDVGPASVWDALASLQVDRIDHGVRSAEDEMLRDYLRRKQIPLTTCPVSNVALNVYSEMADHPIAELFDDGIFVTVNSDDPPMFHADLVENYKRTAETFDLSIDDIVELARHSFEAAFLEDERTNAYLQTVDTEAERLRTELNVD